MSSRGGAPGPAGVEARAPPVAPLCLGAEGSWQGRQDNEAGAFGVLLGELSKEQATECKLERGNHKQGSASGRDRVTGISQ